jgi:tetratricopeptide (TPR) repeat protein
MRFGLLLSLAALLSFAGSLSAQSFRSLNNRGVDDYKAKKFDQAEINFRKAISEDTANFKGYYNLGGAYAKQSKFNDADQAFNAAMTKATSKKDSANAFYNMGTSRLMNKEYEKSLDPLKNSLKLNPNDKDAKYNLSYALQMLKQKQNQDKNKDQNKNDKKDKNKEKNNDQKQDQKKDQDKKDQNENKQNNQQDQQQKQDQQKQQGGAARPKISPEEAKRILESMKNSEQDLQNKRKVKVGVRVNPEKDW